MTFMQIETFSKQAPECESDCADSECETCNPITDEDVICSKCSEHAQLRENTGTECCGGRSRFE